MRRSALLLACALLLVTCDSGPASPPAPPTALTTVAATAAPTPVQSPAPTPTTRAVDNLRVVAQLPLDCPWVLIGEMLVAVQASGELLQLDRPVVDVLTSPDGSPLVITSSGADQYSLLDARTGASLILTVPAGLALGRGALLSPDGSRFALYTLSSDAPGQVLVVDLTSGVVRVALADALGDPIEPIAWDGSVLLTHVQASATSTFWRTDLALPAAQPEEILTVGETGPWAISPAGTALVWSYAGHALVFRDLRTGEEQVLSPRTDANTAITISPDGRNLALLQAAAPGQCCTLQLYDLGRGALAAVGGPLEIASLDWIQGNPGWVWSQDSQRLLVPAGGQAFLLDSQGTVLGRAALPAATTLEGLRLAEDGTALVVARNGSRVTLVALPLAAAAATPALQVALPDRPGSYAIVHAPVGELGPP